ncbi:MAG: aminotransferase class I/II-fold pyridoxal phosphate-dependent enzyme [Bryobacterales bacterium]|nr:aminotransferase class I/II-fold pyridoxal phosphate-dependent enzyme [Bryobacterales bacterium]
MPPRILLSPPDVGRAERESLLDAFDTNWISTAGPAIEEFEASMAAFIGRPCVAVASGTSGLHLALRLAGVAAGDVVLCQTFTFAASANPILYERAEPWFLDSEHRTWNLDPNALEDAIRALARIGRRPRALIAVHLYGMPAEIHSIRDLCDRHGVALIEDAAESLGSTVGAEPTARSRNPELEIPTGEGTQPESARQTGGFGLAGVFSFNGNKIITTAGGGMIAVDSAAAAARLRKWSTQSREPAAHYEHAELGYNYRLSNLLAALGCAQLASLPNKILRRREIFRRYREAFQGFQGVEFQPEEEGSRSNRWLTALYLDPNEWGNCRDALITRLAARGIESRPLWKPMHRQPLYLNSRHFGSSLSEALFAGGICLPSGSSLREVEQQEICEEIAGFLRETSSRDRSRAGHLPMNDQRERSTKRRVSTPHARAAISNPSVTRPNGNPVGTNRQSHFEFAPGGETPWSASANT